MTKRNYFQSVIIFAASLYFIHSVLKLDWVEAVFLILLAVICVVHTMDIRDDWETKRRKRENGKNGATNGQT